MEEKLTTAVEKIAELGKKADAIELGWITKPKELTGVPDKVPVVIKHGDDPGIGDVSLTFETYRLRPERITGTAHATTIQSFIDLVDRHKSEHSAIFADTTWQKPAFTAVIDYHQIDHVPANAKHRIVYGFPLSDDWKIWAKMNGEPMAQEDFAAFVEDRLSLIHISEPTRRSPILPRRPKPPASIGKRSFRPSSPTPTN